MPFTVRLRTRCEGATVGAHRETTAPQDSFAECVGRCIDPYLLLLAHHLPYAVANSTQHDRHGIQVHGYNQCCAYTTTEKKQQHTGTTAALGTERFRNGGIGEFRLPYIPLGCHDGKLPENGEWARDMTSFKGRITSSQHPCGSTRGSSESTSRFLFFNSWVKYQNPTTPTHRRA